MVSDDCDIVPRGAVTFGSLPHPPEDTLVVVVVVVVDIMMYLTTRVDDLRPPRRNGALTGGHSVL
jgi:hypothetical protein